MNRIERLLEQLAPNGVPFATVGDALELEFGQRITKQQDSGSLYPVFGGGGESFRTDHFNREDDVVISRFAISPQCVRRVRGQFWLLDSGFTFSVRDRRLNKDFVAYWLMNAQSAIFACSSQGAQKNLKTEKFKLFRFPVPPLEVQREIVGILDKFTALEAELEAELEARRDQYAHYRDRFFEELDAGLVPRKPLATVGEFMRGRRFTKADFVDEGIPCIHYGEIYTHYGTSAEDTISFLNSELLPELRFAQPRDVVIAGVSETVEDVAKSTAWLGDEPIAIHDDSFAFTSDLNPVYVAHALRTSRFQEQKERHVSRGKMKRIGAKGLGQITIPVPPRDEQDRIVEALDAFDALVANISVGLPAEIAARRKQYEYYRDKLLTFKEAS